MKRTFPRLIGLMLSCMGFIVMTGWLFHIPHIISVIPGYSNMVFNTALCFVLSGLAIYFSQSNPSDQDKIFTYFGIAIFTITTLTLLQYPLQFSLGIDQLFVKHWASDHNPHPGRMALNTNFGFLLTSLCFILFPYTYKQSIALILQITIFSIVLLSIAALLGYLLQSEFLYSWYQYTHMAIHTSIGMSLLGIALWMAWQNSHHYSRLSRENEGKNIIIVSAMILISMTGISCIAGFTIASNFVVNQIEFIIFILIASISIGTLLLYWHISPLINRLVYAKNNALKNQERLQSIFNHASEAIIITDSKGKIESFNQAATKIFGYSDTEAVGINLETLIPDDLHERCNAGMKKYLKKLNSKLIGGHGAVVTGLRKNNERFSMEIAITEMKINNECKYIGMMHDISERKAAEEKLLESETRFRLAFNYSPIGMAIVSLEGRWLKVNKVLCDILGYSESEILQMDFQSITHPDDLEADLNYAKQLHDGEISFYRLEKRYIRKDKKITWILLTGSIIRNEHGIPLYYIAQIQDINEKKKAEEELSFKAYYDSLTGLVNRNQLKHSIDLTISSALRHQHRFAIFFIDLDHFKHINDTLGHNVGDDLLKIIGERLKSSIRKTDIAARLGGDEFILVINGADNTEGAIIFSEKILNVLLKPIKIKGHELFVTASIGISFYPSDGCDYQSLIKSADLALYKAKEKGRNNYQFCTPELNDEIQEKMIFKNALQNAIENNEFYLTYLPKVDANYTITGFETLLRWNNDKYGDVSPAKIIPLAEEMGIINQLGDWILRSAIQQKSQWKETLGMPVKISINISTKHYLQPDFSDHVLTILNDLKLPPSYLALEINETLIMQDPDYSMTVIRQLQHHDIEVIIDNFGTGYSSLNHLSQFKVDYVKIDRQFIQDIVDNFQHLELVTAIVALSKKLNIKVIAEGVESSEQFRLLSHLGCDEFQGYYISKPLTADKVVKFAKHHRRVFEHTES